MTPETLDMKNLALEFMGQSIHGKQNNNPTSKDVPVLILRTYDCVKLHGKGGGWGGVKVPDGIKMANQLVLR